MLHFEPPRDGYMDGYFVYMTYDNRPSDCPASFKTYIRVSDHVNRDDAGQLADAIVHEVVKKERWLSHFVGEITDCLSWQRRLVQSGGIDEMSTGVQAIYFSPGGQLVSFVAVVDAEWMAD